MSNVMSGIHWCLSQISVGRQLFQEKEIHARSYSPNLETTNLWVEHYTDPLSFTLYLYVDILEDTSFCIVIVNTKTEPMSHKIICSILCCYNMRQSIKS